MKIELEISESVFEEIKSSLACKFMAGSAYGILDEVMKKVVQSLENGDETLSLQFKAELPRKKK